MLFVRTNRPDARDFGLPGASLPNQRESKETPVWDRSGHCGKGEMALSRKSSFEIFSELASFEGQKALDSRLVGLMVLAAFLWVLGDLGS